MSRRSRAQASDPLGIVGWVFADLLLALALIFLATQPGDPNAAEAAEAPTTTTTTTVPALQPGVDREYVCFRVTTDFGLLAGPSSPQREEHIAALTAAVREGLKTSKLDGREVGIALTFGVAQTPGEGKAIAEAFNSHVLPLVPETFERSAKRSFWDGGPRDDAPRGSVAVNVYPLTGPDQPPLPSSAPC